MKNVVLTIVIPTLGRNIEIERLLESIKKSHLELDYETIIVDQNTDGLIDDICKRYRNSINLIQHKVSFKGLSRAKNYGIEHANGEYICFPDDDAEFTANTIETALALLQQDKYDAVFGRCEDKETGKDSVINFSKEQAEICISDMEGKFVEATMFAKMSLFSEDRYDEKMGVGEIFGSQEGYDLVYRLLKKNKKLLYNPDIVFYHPIKISQKNTPGEVRRAFYYSCGFGYLCRKHGLDNKYKKRLRKLRFGLPVIFAIRHKEYKYFKAQLMGIQLGYDYLL